MLLSLVWADGHLAAARGPGAGRAGTRPGRRSGRTRQAPPVGPGWKARLMERMEERWRRRQEGDRRM